MPRLGPFADHTWVTGAVQVLLRGSARGGLHAAHWQHWQLGETPDHRGTHRPAPTTGRHEQVVTRMPPARCASAAVTRRRQTTLASLLSALALAAFVAHAAVDIDTVASVVADSEPAQHGLLTARSSNPAQNQGIIFEEVSEIVNYPKAARVDPQSWSFPSGSAGSGNKTMVLAGSTGALKGSTDGGRSWRPVDVHLPDGGAPLSIALDVEGSVGAFADEGYTRKTLTGNGVPDFWLGEVSQGPFTTRSYTIIHTNRSSGSFETTTDENPNNQVTWGRLPALSSLPHLQEASLDTRMACC
eukprot:COSAG06_NODE_1621_length_8896_cov_43.736728_3_plen_300_part_00